MEIAIFLFDGITALDAVGPFEVLSRIPGARVRLVAKEPGPKRTGNNLLSLQADASIREAPHPDIIVVPGGPGAESLAKEEDVLAWLSDGHRTSRWTTSVCTGSLVLGAAGILRGVRATSHWLALNALAAWGAVPVAERVVVDGRIMTAAGVSAGIDMALLLTAKVSGDREAQAIQLAIEYDPKPPFAAGSPSTAPASLTAELRARSRFHRSPGPKGPSPSSG